MTVRLPLVGGLLIYTFHSGIFYVLVFISTVKLVLMLSQLCSSYCFPKMEMAKQGQDLPWTRKELIYDYPNIIVLFCWFITFLYNSCCYLPVPRLFILYQHFLEYIHKLKSIPLKSDVLFIQILAISIFYNTQPQVNLPLGR